MKTDKPAHNLFTTQSAGFPPRLPQKRHKFLVVVSPPSGYLLAQTADVRFEGLRAGNADTPSLFDRPRGTQPTTTTKEAGNTMKKIVAIFATAAAISSANSAVVINEIYSGGGSSSSSAAYQTDFIELFNNGPLTIDLSGFEVQYAPSNRAEDQFDVPVGTLPDGASIAPGGYYLIQTGSSGSGGAPDVTPDVDFTFSQGVSGASLGNAAGSVRLLDASDNVLDLVGWGSLTNNNFETDPETAPSGVDVSMQRIVPGVDTGDNEVDFTQLAPTPTAAIPEPASVAMLGLGAVALGIFRRRR
jgi:hypothetical protein